MQGALSAWGGGGGGGSGFFEGLCDFGFEFSKPQTKSCGQPGRTTRLGFETFLRDPQPKTATLLSSPEAIKRALWNSENLEFGSAKDPAYMMDP